MRFDSPFRFRERSTPIDWKLIQRISVGRVIRDTDVSTLQVVSIES